LQVQVVHLLSIGLKKMDNKNNGFDVMRLTAALLVTFSHSFTIKSGDVKCDFLYRITKVVNFGHSGLVMFFVISGYLITNSWVKNPNIFSFIKKRFLRIYPAIIVNGFIMLFLIIPVVTGVRLTLFDIPYLVKDFLKYSFTFSSLNYNHLHFFKDLKFTEVNGSLWTLRYEIICYAIAPFICLLRSKSSVFLLLIVSAVVYFNLHSFEAFINFENLITVIDLDRVAKFLWYFILGHLAFKYKPSKLFYQCLIICLSIALFLFADKTTCELLAYTLIAGLTLMLALHVKYLKRNLPVDLSYGIYLYSFPIQQLILFKNRVVQDWQILLLTLVFVVPISYLSFICVERKFLQNKNGATI
jgi:peptidoglycan/LPS O-acetylase OafA/YrhL